MKASKEILDLFNQYRVHVGNQQPEVAATLTLAHVLCDAIIGTVEIKTKIQEKKDEQLSEG